MIYINILYIHLSTIIFVACSEKDTFISSEKEKPGQPPRSMLPIFPRMIVTILHSVPPIRKVFIRPVALCDHVNNVTVICPRVPNGTPRDRHKMFVMRHYCRHPLILSGSYQTSTENRFTRRKLSIPAKKPLIRTYITPIASTNTRRSMWECPSKMVAL